MRDAYVERRTGILRASAGGGGGAAGEMRYRERFPQRKARVDLADIHRVKGTVCARVRSLCVPRPSVPCSRERPSARARFPLCNAGDFESIAPLLIFRRKFFPKRRWEMDCERSRTRYENYNLNVKSSLGFVE